MLRKEIIASDVTRQEGEGGGNEEYRIIIAYTFELESIFFSKEVWFIASVIPPFASSVRGLSR